MVFALTGPSGSGKDTISQFFEREGWLIIDLDKLGHEALSGCSEKIKELFGSEIIGKNGKIDRILLGDIVFGSKKALHNLEDVVHPWMKKKAVEILSTNPGSNIIINGSMVITMKLDNLCDFIIYLEAPVLTRFSRVRSRDNKPILNLVKRFFSQRYLKSQIKNSTVDIYNVLNSGNPEIAVAEINRYINDIKRLSHARNK